MTIEAEDLGAAASRGEPATPGAPWRRKAILAAVALVVLAFAGVALAKHWGVGSVVAAPEPRDVPHEEGGAIYVSASYRQRNGLVFSLAERGPLTPVVKVVGTVVLDPRRVAAVGARIPGFVRRVFKLEGDDVRMGEPLAEIESAELGQAQARVSAALAEEYAAGANARREAALLAEHLTTARESEEATATLTSREASLAAARQSVAAMGGTARGPLGLNVLRSPLSGHVVDALVSVGQSVGAHQPTFRVANLDSVWIELDVFERTVGLVRVDDLVEVIPTADPSRRIKGKVAHVGDVIDHVSRSADVRVQVVNSNRLLRPGQSVSAIIHISGPGRETLSVPVDAVTYVDDAPTVFVAVSNDKVVPTTVEIGLTDGFRQEIRSGLKAGDRILSTGVFALKSELFR